jgi:short-subunit dehydrogenase
MPAGRAILITGASSGIGRGIALAYAEPGARLNLLGRNADRLAAVEAAALAKGADVETSEADVRDRLHMAAWLAEADRRRGFDLVIANAGITTGLAPGQMMEDPDAVRAVLATNLFGVLNTIEPLIASMLSRGQGHIAIIGSMAALRPLSYAPAYSAAKAAVHAYADALRGRLEPHGLHVSLVIPGFVKTPLNDSISARKPWEMSENEAARVIRRGLDRKKAIIAFPRRLYAIAVLGRLLPPRFVDWTMDRFTVSVPETAERVDDLKG